MVCMSTILQSTITAKDGEWAPVTEFKFLDERNHYQEEHGTSFIWKNRVYHFISPVINVVNVIAKSFSMYWRSQTQGSEAPPYFAWLSMEASEWPEDGIQPERIETGLSQLLMLAQRCETKIPIACHSASKVRIQSVQRS
ncbi:uncharacterized protein A4U43_C08F30740 [Asparagus officinalis]|nr:uncharacterized protein A4U43_C08F30740 [Asparagus officinalis]